MKILILSDSHGFSFEIEQILKNERSADMIIHLGDGSADLYNISEYTAGKPLYQLKGNCDPSAYGFPLRLISYADKIKFYACHGHTHNVKTDIIPLFYAAKEENCKIALFGHTHTAFSQEYDGVRLFNPGSVRNGRYGLLEVKGEIYTLRHCSLTEI